jgi:DNA-binding response OmpR family regulator
MARILIVEDENVLRRILTLNLVRRGHTVAEATDVVTADEALCAAPTPFDLILLDINLPDGSGWDVLRHFTNLGSDTSAAMKGAEGDVGHQLRTTHPQVIVLTAVRPVRSRIDEFKPAAVLLKPFPITTFLRVIDRVLVQPPEGEQAETEPPEPSGPFIPPSQSALLY